MSSAKKKNANGEAEEILRSVLVKDPLHACAIQVLGDLLEAGLISPIYMSYHTREHDVRGAERVFLAPIVGLFCRD